MSANDEAGALRGVKADERKSKSRKTEDFMDPGYGIGWGTLALINAGLAQCHERRALPWFFLSLFIGPIATLLIVILD